MYADLQLLLVFLHLIASVWAHVIFDCPRDRVRVVFEKVDLLFVPYSHSTAVQSVELAKRITAETDRILALKNNLRAGVINPYEDVDYTIPLDVSLIELQESADAILRGVELPVLKVPKSVRDMSNTLNGAKPRKDGRRVNIRVATIVMDEPIRTELQFNMTNQQIALARDQGIVVVILGLGENDTQAHNVVRYFTQGNGYDGIVGGTLPVDSRQWTKEAFDSAFKWLGDQMIRPECV